MPSGSTRESAIESRAVKLARRAGWLAIKQGGQGNSRGWPDRLFVSECGKHVWIEFKRPGGVLTDLQRKKIAELIARRVAVAVCYSADECLAELTAAVRPGTNYYPGAAGL